MSLGILANTPLALCATAAEHAMLEHCALVFERSNVVEKGAYWLITSFTSNVAIGIGMWSATKMMILGQMYRFVCALMTMSNIYVTFLLGYETCEWVAAHFTDPIQACSLCLASCLALAMNLCGLWNILFFGHESQLEWEDVDEKATPLLLEDGLRLTDQA
jgi:hypothetical protein